MGFLRLAALAVLALAPLMLLKHARKGAYAQMVLTVLAAVLVGMWLFWPEQFQQIFRPLSSGAGALHTPIFGD